LKTIIIVIASLLLIACGGSEFESGWAVPDSDGAVELDAEADAPTPPDALPEAGEDSAIPDADEDAPAPDAAPEAGEDSAAPDADAGEDAPTPPDAAPEAGEDSAAPDAAPDVCVPITCQSAGKDCGPIQDGCGGTINCGSCPTNTTCGGGGIPNVCGGCVPIKCEDVPQYCGELEDGCGNTVDCGPYKRGYDPSCSSTTYSHKWYCSPEQYWAPPPFETCVPAGTWPGSYCCIQGD